MDTDTSEAARQLARLRWGDPQERREARRAALVRELEALDAAEDKEEADG